MLLLLFHCRLIVAVVTMDAIALSPTTGWLLPPVVLLLMLPLVSVVAIFVLVWLLPFFCHRLLAAVDCSQFFLRRLLLLFFYTGFCCYFCHGWLIFTAFFLVATAVFIVTGCCCCFFCRRPDCCRCCYDCCCSFPRLIVTAYFATRLILPLLSPLVQLLLLLSSFDCCHFFATVCWLSLSPPAAKSCRNDWLLSCLVAFCSHFLITLLSVSALNMCPLEQFPQVTTNPMVIAGWK